jgi:hypothetical protein
VVKDTTFLSATGYFTAADLDLTDLTDGHAALDASAGQHHPPSLPLPLTGLVLAGKGAS